MNSGGIRNSSGLGNASAGVQGGMRVDRQDFGRNHVKKDHVLSDKTHTALAKGQYFRAAKIMEVS